MFGSQKKAKKKKYYIADRTSSMTFCAGDLLKDLKLCSKGVNSEGKKEGREEGRRGGSWGNIKEEAEEGTRMIDSYLLPNLASLYALPISKEQALVFIQFYRASKG